MLKAKFFFLLFFSSILETSYLDYIYPHNSPTYNEYGSTGYLVTPSAYFHNEGVITLLSANSSPYERLGITAHPTDWLEAVYRYTNLEDVLFGGQLGLLDKSFDAKIS